MEKEIKQILLDLIYTPDAKPRFVGGDLDTKFKYIDEAVAKVINLYSKVKELTYLDKAADYLVEDDEASIYDMVENIKKQAELDENMLIDWVNGVNVWEKCEFEFTCKEFLKLIGV